MGINKLYMLLQCRYIFIKKLEVFVVDTYKITISSDISNICKTVDSIICYIKKSVDTLDEKTIYNFKVVLNELILNSIIHGNKNNPEKQVYIKVCIFRSSLVLTVEDEGCGCDYKGIIKRENDLCKCDDIDLLCESGRGILIACKISDIIRFNGKGNKISVLIKNSNT